MNPPGILTCLCLYGEHLSHIGLLCHAALLCHSNEGEGDNLMQCWCSSEHLLVCFSLSVYESAFILPRGVSISSLHSQYIASERTECRSTTKVFPLLLVLPLVLTLALAFCLALCCSSNRTLITNVSRAVSLVCLHAMFTPKVLWFVCCSFSQ